MNEILKYYNNVVEKVDFNKLLKDIFEGENIQKNWNDLDYEQKVNNFIRKIDKEYFELVMIASAEIKVLSLLFGTSRNFGNANTYQSMNSYLNFLYSLKNSKLITGGINLLSEKVGV